MERKKEYREGRKREDMKEGEREMKRIEKKEGVPTFPKV